jgi:Zn-dependent peptidase ImmA (M78 family)
MKVPWLPKEAIVRMAGGVIADYEDKVGRRLAPPIPVEGLIEFGLELGLVFEDLRGKLGMDDVLGATYVKSRTVSVDIGLDRPEAEGRLCFTLAHEAGHWVMHRELLDLARRNGGFIFCRTRDAKKPVEWQADFFASCLLMPEVFVKQAFERVCGRPTLVLHNVESAYAGPICIDPCAQNWPAIADCVRRAGGFSNVSKQAMIIRLQGLGLVQNETGTPLTWRGGTARF